MTKIITVTIKAPLWRAGKVRDALAPTLVRSVELTVGESWSWRQPLAWRFTLTGPAFQVHKAAGDAQPLGTVHYAKYAIAGVLGVAALVAIPVVRHCWAGDGDPGSRSGYLGGSPGARTTGREVGRKEAWRDGYKGILKYFSTSAGTITTFQPYLSAGYISEDGICCTDRWQIGVLNYSSGTQRALIDTVERSFAPLDSAGRLVGGV